MGKRISLVLLIMILAITALFFAASHPTGPNTVSFGEPINLLLSLGTLVFLLMPPFILAFFNHIAVSIISAIYQAFIVLFFLGLILVGILIPSMWILGIGVLGAITSIISIIVTILDGLKKEKLAVT